MIQNICAQLEVSRISREIDEEEMANSRVVEDGDSMQVAEQTEQGGQTEQKFSSCVDCLDYQSNFIPATVREQFVAAVELAHGHGEPVVPQPGGSAEK